MVAYGVTWRRDLVVLLILCLPSVAAQAGKNCTCRAAGHSYEQGQVLCIRGRLARCDMFLNNTSWTFISERCPEAFLGNLPLLHGQLTYGSSAITLPSC
jgi:hypothetical protein